MHRGYIKYWRKTEEWSWYKDSKTFHLFMHLLSKSNHKDSNYMGVSIPRGSCVTGLHALKSQLGISVRSLRTCINRLKSTNDITIKSTNRFSVVSIVNYEHYQENTTNESTSDMTNDRQATDKQPTTSKEYIKNDKKKDAKAFSIPSLEDVSSYLRELSSKIDGGYFIDYYNSRGWMVGKSKMKDWKSTIRNWERRNKEQNRVKEDSWSKVPTMPDKMETLSTK